MLSGKQKRFLRAMASKQKAIVMVGKDGLTYNLFDSLKKALSAHELVKVSVLKSLDEDVREIAIELSANSGGEIVQIIGRSIVLYKPSKEHLITLP